MSKKPTSPETLYGTGRDYLREQIKTNEILADIAGIEYTPPEGVPKGKYMENKWLLDAAEKKNELLEEIAEGGPGGGSAAAKAIGIDYATDGIFLKNKNGDTIQGSGATLPAYGVTFDPATGGLTLTKNGTAVQGQTVTIPNYGSPVGVDASADMTDHDKIYLYLGTTGGGLTNGHFYYWDGAAWADGGEYAAATVQTDKTLLVEDRAADAKATGDAVNSLKTQLRDSIIYSKNLLDVSKNTPDTYIDKTTGEAVSTSGWQASDYIEINPTETYILTRWAGGSGWNVPNSTYYAFYDNGKEYTHGGSTTDNNKTIVAEAGDVFIRISAANNYMNTQPMFGTYTDLNPLVGTTDPDDYIPFALTLYKDSLTNPVKYNSGRITEFGNKIVRTKNILDVSKNSPNKKVNNNDGTLTDTNNWQASDYIEIAPETDYVFIRFGSGVGWTQPESTYYAFYDGNKQYTHGGYSASGNLSITSWKNDLFVRVSQNNVYMDSNAMFGTYTDFHNLVGTTDIDDYVTFGNTLYKDTLKREVTANKNSIDEINAVEIILPDTLYIAIGRQITIYKPNCIKAKNINDFVLYWGGGTYPYAKRTTFDEGIRFEPDTAGTYTINLYVYNPYTVKEITSKTLNIVVVADTERSNKKVIFIGDSLTNSGFYPYEIQKHLSGEGLTSIGTRTTTAYLDSDPTVTSMVSVNHEGRGGWSAKDYVTQSTKGGVSNAFWNPNTNKFDFSYYMTQQGYSGIDIVFVNLGTNGTTDIPGEINAINEIITSIHAYSANMPVVVSAIACGNATQDTYIDEYLREIRIKQLEEFDGEIPNVYIAPIYLNINRYTDWKTHTEVESARNPLEVIRQYDSVHPSKYGYWKFADVYWSVIQYILSLA